MEHVTIIARKNVLNLQWGDVATVPANSYVEMLVNTGCVELVEPGAVIEVGEREPSAPADGSAEAPEPITLEKPAPKIGASRRKLADAEKAQSD